MHPPLADGFAVRGSIRRHRFWHSALSGLTPQVVALVAALLFIRTLSSTVDEFIYKANNHELGWSSRLLTAYAGLLVMAAPMLVVIIATVNLGPQRGVKRVAALATAVILSTAAGVLLRIEFRQLIGTGVGWEDVPGFFAYVWPRYAVLSGMLTVVGEFHRREVASTEAMQRAETDRAAFEREMAEARLQALQAQIEPHFLFNTLANVRRLYDKDLAAGGRMLANLMRYLEVALPQMRNSESTLGRDSDLVEAFLRIHQIRMGRRLAFSIDVPLGLRACPVPPMMLLTLVENAIKHGLNPSLDGGLIRVTARTDGELLILSVADTGVGFRPGSGAGTGLANIRARLAAQFGDGARLALENNELGGVTATIALPLTSAVMA